jgi:diacylglycerol kinase (ATP)
MRNKEKRYGIVDSFNFAIEGIIEAIRTEKNMKFHAFCTIVVLLLILFVDINRFEVMALSISIALVWLAELINTGIESGIDLFCKTYHPLAKRAKDVGAGAVLVAAINALVVGYVIFEKKISLNLGKGFLILKNSTQHTLVFILTLLVVLVIVIKTIFKKGTPLRGGIPSGHSALAASISTAIFFLTENSKIFFLSLILLLLVLQSRVEGKIHTVLETIIGACLGGGITYLVMVAFEF